MVERPIKKSEREAQQQEQGERSTPAPIKAKDKEVKAQEGGESPRSSRNDRDSRDGRGSRENRGKGKGKGRGGRRDEAKAPPVNPALVRGPRPVMTPAVEEEPPNDESVADTDAAATSDESVADTDAAAGEEATAVTDEAEAEA